MESNLYGAIEEQYNSTPVEVIVRDGIYDQVTLIIKQGGDSVNLFLSLEQVEQMFGKINNYLQEREDKKAHAEAVALAQFDAQRDDQVESISLA
jgi:serine kinase of HPr protein (carbohydrate metabolism regulator)